MDIHTLQGATPEQVEVAHAADLKVQGKYHVEYLKFWFNESHGKAFGRPIHASPPPVWAEFDTDRLKVVITLSFALKVQNTEQSTDAVP